MSVQNAITKLELELMLEKVKDVMGFKRWVVREPVDSRK
jgi:hypothetical protein